MFGTVSSAGIFDRFNKLLVILAVKISEIEKEKVVRYLDDTFGVESRFGSKLGRFYRTYLGLCEMIGVKMDKSGNPNKAQAPATTATILGVNFDTVAWKWSMPPHKGAKVLALIDTALREHLSDQQRQSLVGCLNDYGCLFPEARQHMAPMFRYLVIGEEEVTGFRDN